MAFKMKGASLYGSPLKKTKVTYSEAYKRLKPTKSGGRYDEKSGRSYKSEAEFTAAAKAYNTRKNAPKKEAVKKEVPKKVQTKKVVKVNTASKPVEPKKVAVKTKADKERAQVEKTI